MKKYPVRWVFIVTRQCSEATMREARNDAGLLADEGGECLYGGGAGEETLKSEVQICKDGEWVTVHY